MVLSLIERSILMIHLEASTFGIDKWNFPVQVCFEDYWDWFI